MTSIVYPTPTVTVARNGNLTGCDDTTILSATAAPVVHFNSAFTFHFGGQLMSFAKGTTHVVSAALKSALQSIGAPITVIQ
jgi:hypothetical protein